MTKGKNYSCNNVEGKRKKSDFYETPYSMTRRFLDLEKPDKSWDTLEPACGDGAIVDVLRDCGFSSVTGYDIETDFLTETGEWDYIITNPPFSLALDFIQTAKRVSKFQFSFLLPLSYLHGKQRYDSVYSDVGYRLRSVDVFTRYPMLGEPLRDDGKYNTGMMVYAWFTWDRKHADAPIIRWIDNNEDIIRK